MSDSLFEVYERLAGERASARQAIAEQVESTEQKIISLETFLHEVNKREQKQVA